MHATDLVGINGITRVLLVYSCQQGVHPSGHVLPLDSQICKPLAIIISSSAKQSNHLLIIRFTTNWTCNLATSSRILTGSTPRT
jgi:hypothetical protein